MPEGRWRDRAMAVALSAGAALYVLLPALGPRRVLGSWRHPDNLGNHWLLEWTAGQLRAGGSLLHNDRYYWPVGDAPLLAGNGMEGLPYLPFAQLLPWPASATAFAAAQLSFAGAGAYALARAAGAGPGGGWLAAVALASHPYLAAELTMGHFSQVDLGWMCLSLAALLRTLDGGGRLPAVICGVCGGITALLYWYHGLFLGLAAAVALGASALSRRREGLSALPWGALALAAGVAALVCGPWLAVSLAHLSEVPGVGEAFPAAEATEAVVQLGWPVAAKGAWQQARVVAPVLLLLAPLGLRGGGGRWALLAALGGLLAMGGAPYEGLHGLAEPLRRFWWPYRYGVLLQLGVIVLAARGVSALPGRPWLGLALAVSVPAQLSLTGDLRQVKASPLATPAPAYGSLARMPQGLVLEPPLSPGSSQSQALLAAQLIHDKPLITGHAMWVDRVRPEAWDAFVAQNPSLAALSRWELGGPGEIPIEGLVELREAGWRYLVVDRGRFAKALSAQAAGWERLGAALGKVVMRAEGVTVYEIGVETPRHLALPEVRWPAQLEPAGPRHPLDATPWPEPLFEEIIDPGAGVRR
ncbi:MAG: hypothetical protein H6741_26440 [Alphaproteobacteria bacterium]|nr:hypothetical protein [Alphaproteobacteria bacterium]MCB9796248.1 hypothetical protein [Alphaproteobacteria bacterium]